MSCCERKRAGYNCTVVELILLPFFMPLLLIGWIIDNPEREARQRRARQQRAFPGMWLQLHGSVDEVQQLDS